MKKALLFFVLAIIVCGLQAQTQVKTVAKTVPGSSLLKGILYAPTSTSITLQNSGKNDLIVSIPKEPGKVYGSKNFNFPTPILDSTKFNVTLKKAAGGQTTVIYSGGEGIMPQGENLTLIGSDFTYDHVSRSSDDKTFSTFYETYDPAIGGVQEEGRYIAFVSASSGFSGTTGKHRQIFWRDRNTGMTKIISAASNGEEGNGDSYAPAISGDGLSVAFESYSSNLVPNDGNGVRDIFLWHSATNSIERVSVGAGGKESNADSYEASVSGDGNLVAFTSTASNISAVDKGISNNNVFLRDLQSKTTTMISIDPKARKGSNGSNASISYDGSRIAFYSHTGTLVANDNNGFWDIFLWEKDNPKLKRISLTADHKERNQGEESANRIVVPTISGDGNFITFSTTANNMATVDTNVFQDVFVYDIAKDTTIIASISSDGKQGDGDSPIGQGEKIAISYDGKWVAFSTKATNLGVPAANIVMRNMLTGKNKIVSSVVGSNVGRPSISQTGSYVVFGIGGQIDGRFPSSGIFANYTGVGPCRFFPK
ncbi:MAG: hypothetical protein WC384_22335 [Prolixibacteraceae bacterium]|jgi:hypothetical protein